MIKGLDHITIIVKDFEGAIAQYKKILNIDTVRRSPLEPNRGRKSATFEFGATNFEIITATDDTGPWARRLAARGDGFYLVALKVDNLRETVEELRAKGVRLAEDPGPGTEPITGRVLVHPAVSYGVMISLLER